MKPVILFAIVFVLLFPLNVSAFEYDLNDDFFISYGKCDISIDADNETFEEVIAEEFSKSMENAYCKQLENSKFEFESLETNGVFGNLMKDNNETPFTFLTDPNKNDLAIILPPYWNEGDSLIQTFGIISEFEYVGSNTKIIHEKIIDIYEFEANAIKEEDGTVASSEIKIQYDANSGFLLGVFYKTTIDHTAMLGFTYSAVVTADFQVNDISGNLQPRQTVENIPESPSINSNNELDSNNTLCGEGMFSKDGVCTAICGDGTYFEDGKCKLTETSTVSSSESGGCLIATATYGSELAPQVQQLRELRDNQLLSTTSGTHFMNTFTSFYYSFSPIIADYERENPVFKEMVKVAITPMITSLSLMEYADSEESVVSIGISLILLNMMMYVGIPILAVMRFRK